MRKTDLNAIYISERVQETLRPVSVSALTAVVAPMGYGKTTAVNWFLNQRRQTEAAHHPAGEYLFRQSLHLLEKCSERLCGSRADSTGGLRIPRRCQQRRPVDG